MRIPSGWLSATLLAGFLLSSAGCGTPTELTQEPSETARANQANPVRLLMAKHKVPERQRNVDDPDVRITRYNREGEVVASLPMPKREAWRLWQQMKVSHTARPGMVHGSGSALRSNRAEPEAAVLADTSVVIVINGVEHTLESATTSTEAVAVLTEGENEVQTLDWVSYSESGDSVIVSSALALGYYDGSVEIEVYFSPAAVSDLNGTINEPETAPIASGPSASGWQCAISVIRAAGALGLSAVTIWAFLKAPTGLTLGLMQGAKVIAIAEVLQAVCDCTEECAETAPGLLPAGRSS